MLNVGNQENNVYKICQSTETEQALDLAEYELDFIILKSHAN